MKSLKGITSFVCVAIHGSFAKAAQELGVSAVAVSKNVATLEQQLGVRLFQRTTRSLKLTVEGQSYLEQCQGPLRELEAAQVTLQRNNSALSGLIRVTSVTPFGLGFIAPLLRRFQALHPKVQIQLHLDDAVRDMVSSSYDIGIRVGQLKDAGYIARPIAPMSFVVCGSPGYLSQHGVPHRLADLSRHNCLRLNRVGNLESMPWFLQGLTETMSQALPSDFSCNAFAPLVQAACAGQGLVCAPIPLVMSFLRAGQLKPLLTEHVSTDLLVYLHYPSRKNLPARTRALVDYLLLEFAGEADLHTQAKTLLEPYLFVDQAK